MMCASLETERLRTYRGYHQFIDGDGGGKERFSLLRGTGQSLVLHDIHMVAEILYGVDGMHRSVSGIQGESRGFPGVFFEGSLDIDGQVTTTVKNSVLGMIQSERMARSGTVSVGSDGNPRCRPRRCLS